VSDHSGHEYDGIIEEDNQLPRWWLATFFLAVGFGFFYWQYYQVLGIGPGTLDELRADADRAEKVRTGGRPEIVTDDQMMALVNSPAPEAGKQVFMSTCVSCHGAGAEGKIGPNLTDNFWIHGGKPSDIWNTVTNGYPLKGMPSWKSLGSTKVKQVAAYVLTLRGKNVPGKGPEGTEWVPGAAAPAAPAAGAADAGAPAPAPDPDAGGR
jgi:cytochrome c oxidase cbb3-type subunit 3